MASGRSAVSSPGTSGSRPQAENSLQGAKTGFPLPAPVDESVAVSPPATSAQSPRKGPEGTVFLSPWPLAKKRKVTPPTKAWPAPKGHAGHEFGFLKRRPSPAGARASG